MLIGRQTRATLSLFCFRARPMLARLGVDQRPGAMAALCRQLFGKQAIVLPINRETPTSPSLPTTAISAEAPFSITTPLAIRSEPRADILSEQFRLFHRSEMPTTRHLGPTLHVEESLRPCARRLTYILREEGEGCRHFGRTGPLLHSFLYPGQCVGICIIVVRQKRARD